MEDKWIKREKRKEEMKKERNEEKTATADASIVCISCKQNELNASIQHSSALLLKRKESEKRERYILRNATGERQRKREIEKKKN